MNPACTDARGLDGKAADCKSVDSGFDSHPRVQFSHGDITVILDTAHAALRGIDAADTTAIIPAKELDAVSDAVMSIETFARRHSIPISEFAGRMPVASAHKRSPTDDEILDLVPAGLWEDSHHNSIELVAFARALIASRDDRIVALAAENEKLREDMESIHAGIDAAEGTRYLGW